MYTTKKISWCPYALFINSAKEIKSNCNYKKKPQKHNVAYTLKKNWGTVYGVNQNKMFAKDLQNWHQDPFQLIYMPTAYEASSRNIYILATIEWMNNYPTLTLNKPQLSFKQTHMNITDYLLMQSLNVTCLTPPQLEELSHTSTNYSMVKYDLLKKSISKLIKKYPFALPAWLIILIIVLGTPVTATGIVPYCCGKYRWTRIYT